MMKESWKSMRLGGTLIVLLAVVAYLPAMRGGFIWDDDDHLTKNPAVLSVEGLKQIWSSLAVSRYYPLTLTSFWMQHRLWGLHPLPYHAVNVALHAVNAVLLWVLLRRLKVRGAWVAATLWALHPVCVESVAWVTELKNTQSGLFFLLALLVFLRFEHGLRPRDYMIALVCGAAAMLSKPSTVVLPGVMLLCAWWQRGRWTRSDFLRVAPLVAFAVGMSLLTIAEQRRHIEGGRALEWTLTAAQRLVLAGHAVWFYAGKLLWPTDLCFIYPRWELRVPSAEAWLPVAGLALVAGTLWHFRRAGWARATTFGLGYFILALLPVLGFFDIFFFQFSFVADHFQYLASMGLIALVVGAGTTVCRRAGQRGRHSGMLAVAAVLTVLGVSTWRQERIYKDLETLWRDTLAKNPNAWMPHNNLGVALADQGKVSEAIKQYEQALRLKPDYAPAHCNLGIAFIRQGKVPEAVAEYAAALQIKPDYAEAHYNLGVALANQGQVPEAIAEYAAALQIKPDYAEAHNNLGVALANQGRISEAIAEYAAALWIKPDYAEAHYNLGIAFIRQGKVPEAIEQFEQALRIKPDYADAHNNLANVLLQQGKVPEAIKQYEHVLRIKPDSAEAHNNLGLALANQGKVSEAISQYEQALRIRPDYAKAHDNLGVALANQGKVLEAVEQFEQVLRIKPDSAEAHNNLANVLLQQGNVSEAIAQYREALRLRPDLSPVLYRLAWILATDGNANLRNAGEAIQLAERLCAVTGYQQASALDVLAAAYAEAGRFSDAIRVAQQAVESASTAGQQEMAQQVQDRLKLYQAGRPFHEGSAAQTPPS